MNKISKSKRVQSRGIDLVIVKRYNKEFPYYRAKIKFKTVNIFLVTNKDLELCKRVYSAAAMLLYPKAYEDRITAIPEKEDLELAKKKIEYYLKKARIWELK